MSNPRNLLFIALLFISFLLYDAWQRDYATKIIDKPLVDPTNTIDEFEPFAEESDIPEAVEASPQTVTSPAMATTNSDDAASQTVTVTTDLLRLTIDTRGGNILAAQLLDYPISLDDDSDAYTLLENTPLNIFWAQSGISNKEKIQPDARSQFTVNQSSFNLQSNSNELIVPFIWNHQNGVSFVKEYVFTRGEYAIKVNHKIINSSDSSWQGNSYYQFQRTFNESDNSFSFTEPRNLSFKGAAIFSPEEGFQKIDTDDMDEGSFTKKSSGGWSAMIQHYFFSAWIPPKEQSFIYSSAVLRKNSGKARYIILARSPQLTVESGGNANFENTLYIGPKLQKEIDSIAPGLELTVDYGIFTVISQPVFWVMEKIHSFVGNWGIAIILVTMLIKLIFFKLSEAQYKSMAKMRRLQPRMLALKERYKNDKQKLNQAVMEMYKKEKANPLGGCLPVLVQIPVFIALYWVLLESVELRQAPFALWLNDLSSPDRFFVLPVMMGLGMFFQQKLSPMVGSDPIQQKVMMMMPVMMTVMFAFFQSGLVLYWTVNQLLSLAQQWYITKRIDAADTKN